MASNEHVHHHHHSDSHKDHSKCVTVDCIIIISLGVISLILNLVFSEISYQTFLGPVLYMATGALGLSYLKYKEDTYATIFKIFIWVEIVFNVIAILYLSFILFFTGLLGAATVCLPEDLQCQSADDALFIINLILGITDLICLGVVILMCLTLSHFNKVEHDRKSHHYEMQKQ